MGITLKVKPDQLVSAANDISSQITNVETACGNLGTAIKNSKSYWEGEASNLHQKKYTDIEDEISQVLSTLKHRPDDLLKMAGLYDKAESTNTTTAAALSSNLIF